MFPANSFGISNGDCSSFVLKYGFDLLKHLLKARVIVEIIIGVIEKHQLNIIAQVFKERHVTVK